MQIDNNLDEIFKKLTQELVKNNIEFSIAGAFAASLYTQPRATSDIDLVTFLDNENKEKVTDILERNFKLIQSNPNKIPMRFFEISRYVIKNGSKNTIIVPIDFISVPKEYLESILKKSFILQLNNIDVKFISKEDLILMKLNSTRAKDIDDIEQIVKGSDKLDIDYIKSWAKKYSLNTEMLGNI